MVHDALFSKTKYRHVIPTWVQQDLQVQIIAIHFLWIGLVLSCNLQILILYTVYLNEDLL
jgi:hypothetical protein